MFNALQPGVFSLSGWDLLGMLTLDPEKIAPLLATGDTRWIHRSAYDLMGFQAESEQPRAGMPKAVSLYGPLPQQLKDQWSFVSQLQRILELRNRYGIATSTQVDVPDVSNKAMLVMVHELKNPAEHQVTVLNFGAEPIVGTINSTCLRAGSAVLDMFTDEVIGEVDDLHSFSIALDGHQGRSLFMSPPEDLETQKLPRVTLA
jgi:trehalose synthase